MGMCNSSSTLSSGKEVTLLNQQIFNVKQFCLLIFVKMATMEQGTHVSASVHPGQESLGSDILSV